MTNFLSKSLWASKSFKNSYQRVQMIDILLKYVHPLIWFFKRSGCPRWFKKKYLSQKRRSSRTILILSMLWQCRICLTHIIIYMWSKKLFLSFLKDLIFESRLNQYAAWAILWFSFASGKKEKVENWSLQETTKTNGISSGNGWLLTTVVTKPEELKSEPNDRPWR